MNGFTAFYTKVPNSPGWGVVANVIEPRLLFVTLQRAVLHQCVSLCFEFTRRLEKHTIVKKHVQMIFA